MPKTRAFKSGNSIAVRFPKSLGLVNGTEMNVREEQGRYIVEPVRKKIDWTGIIGAAPSAVPLPREEFDDLPRAWHLLGEIKEE